MAFRATTQGELHNLDIVAGQQYQIRYINKDYYNGEETIEEGMGTAIITDGNIYFSVVDPYGMDKLVMQVQVIQR